jgi:hypothetical protein
MAKPKARNHHYYIKALMSFLTANSSFLLPANNNPVSLLSRHQPSS